MSAPVAAADPAPGPSLLRGAIAVLSHNWKNLHTLPATGLYPHQWSWDSAFIAIGLRHLSPRRAAQEIETLLRGQWSDGRVPQIAFDTSRDDDYSPGASFWRSDRIPGSPSVPTAGLVQPPNHAWACLLVHQADPVESERRHFLARMYPQMLAWHGYLRERRTHASTGLAHVVHPWETGMDNAPAWDPVLVAVTAVRLQDSSGNQAPIPRPDLLHSAPTERPSNADYANYLYLAGRYRDHGCDDQDADHPFVVEDPTFNAIWARSELALADIAALIGADPEPHRAQYRQLTDSLAGLWNTELAVYVPRNVRTGEQLPVAAVSGLVPLILPDVPHARELVRTATGPRFSTVHTTMVPSYDLTAADFDGARYWRGPAWFNMTWLVAQGLRSHGRADEANELADAMIEAAVRNDFPEYINPMTGQAHGTRQFSWTAALALDLCDRSRTPREGRSDK